MDYAKALATMNRKKLWYRHDAADLSDLLWAACVALAYCLLIFTPILDYAPGVKQNEQRIIDIKDLDKRDQEALINRLRIEAAEEGRRKKRRIAEEQDKAQGPVRF